MTKRRNIADWLRAKGFPPLSEDQYQDNIRALVPTVCFCEETAMTTDKVTGTFEDRPHKELGVTRTVKAFMEISMTTDLSNKSDDELVDISVEVMVGADCSDASFRRATGAVDELARRLEEAQQRNAAHDAKVAAEAKAEALKDAAHWFLYNWFGPIEEDWYDLNKPVKILEKMAAEYRAKATEAGGKE